MRTRNHIARTYQMRTQLQSVSMQLSTMRTNEAMAGAMGNVVKIMAKMNKSMNLPATQNVLMQFEMEHGKMEMTQEMYVLSGTILFPLPQQRYSALICVYRCCLLTDVLF